MKKVTWKKKTFIFICIFNTVNTVIHCYLVLPIFRLTKLYFNTLIQKYRDNAFRDFRITSFSFFDTTKTLDDIIRKRFVDNEILIFYLFLFDCTAFVEYLKIVNFVVVVIKIYSNTFFCYENIVICTQLLQILGVSII